MTVVSPIIVTYNSAGTLGRVLDALEGQVLDDDVALDVVVVDKGSSDSTLDVVAERSDITCVDLPIPMTGPGVGFNRGVEVAAGSVIMLLTGDMVLQSEDIVARVARKVIAEPRAVFGGKILTSEGDVQHSRGSWPSIFAVAAYRARRFEHRAMHHWTGYDTDRDVDWVCGGFAFFSRALWEEVGGYDTDYFLYFEDMDFCRRAADLGAPSRYLADLVALHDHPAEDRKSRKGHWLDSYALYCRKHYSLLSPTRILAAAWQAVLGAGVEAAPPVLPGE